MADLTGNEQRSHFILVPAITRHTFDEFIQWKDQFSWRDGIGYVLFPQGIQSNRYILMLDSGSYNHTWFNEALPEILEFFGGEERVIYSVVE